MFKSLENNIKSVCLFANGFFVQRSWNIVVYQLGTMCPYRADANESELASEMFNRVHNHILTTSPGFIKIPVKLKLIDTK